MKNPTFKVIRNGTTILAISSFAGKTVKGVAKLDPRDSFDPTSGEELAKARCRSKIAQRRLKWAEKRLLDCEDQVNLAYANHNKALEYYYAAMNEDFVSSGELRKIEDDLNGVSDEEEF